METGEIKKYIKQVRAEANEDMKMHLGVLNEMHAENLKGIREGFIIVNRKLDSHTKILDSHTKILDSHTKILDSHTEMIGELKIDMTGVKDRLGNVEGRLDRIEDKLEIKEAVAH